MEDSDYVLLDTGLNYAFISRYKGVPSAGILIDKPLDGVFTDDVALLDAGDVPIGRNRIKISTCANILKTKRQVATFTRDRCLELGLDYEEELSGYACIQS